MLRLRVIVEYRNIEVDSSFMNYVFGGNDLETFYGVLVMVCCLISDNPQVITCSALKSAALVGVSILDLNSDVAILHNVATESLLFHGSFLIIGHLDLLLKSLPPPALFETFALAAESAVDIVIVIIGC
jgi:hypothetical protein